MLDHTRSQPNSASQIAEISAAFRRARSQGAHLQQFPGALPSTLELAYGVQHLSIQQWPDTLIGWKVGGVGGGFRERYGADRLAGPIFKRNLRYAESGETTVMRAFAGGFAAVEAEFVVCLGEVDASVGPDSSIEALMRVVRSVHIGVEIASSPLPTINVLGPAAVISDFGNNAGLIVGPSIEAWTDLLLSQIEVSVAIDNEQVGRACAAPGKVGPLGAVAFTLDHCRRHGYALPPGTFITTGAISGVHDAAIGSHSVVDFEGVGRLHIDLVAFDALPAR